MSEITANIHHFVNDPNNGPVHLDDDGEPLHGFYYEICNAQGTPLHEMMGPYQNAAEAERAAHKAWRTKSYG